MVKAETIETLITAEQRINERLVGERRKSTSTNNDYQQNME